MSVKILQGQGFSITMDNIRTGIENVVRLTGLKGRWQKLGDSPLIICDTGHNVDGLKEVVQQIKQQKCKNLFIVLGMVKDKDISHALKILPPDAYYIFCQANIPRALDTGVLKDKANAVGLRGEIVNQVNEAIKTAKSMASREDFIFIGGSTFVVGEIENL